ncbi:MAG: Holliday junction branch migration protein RuvA [Bacteroidia bacterium]|nr:Holliday junction branch migration protein RuvA [Bacteroidia bacterium]
MIEFLEGTVDEMAPTHAVINVNGVGYFAHISLNAYERLNGKKQLRLLTYLSIKEDSHTLYGFYDHTERTIFLHLISVSGIGPTTARMILSSLNHNEIIGAILNGNVALLKSIKGIGPKAAQRMILELKDKMGKIGGGVSASSSPELSNINEALEALQALGFARNAAEKAILKISKELGDSATTENLIKNSLKLL